MLLHKTAVHLDFEWFWLPPLSQRGHVETRMGTEERKWGAKGMLNIQNRVLKSGQDFSW